MYCGFCGDLQSAKRHTVSKPLCALAGGVLGRYARAVCTRHCSAGNHCSLLQPPATVGLFALLRTAHDTGWPLKATFNNRFIVYSIKV